MSHSLIIQKLAKYGADDNTVSLIKDYLRGHKQLIKNICRKVSQQIAVLKRMKKLLPLKLREKLYRTFIAPHFNYCAESWHFCSNRLTGKLKKLNEQALRFVYQDKISTYETLVVKNGYSTLANQRLAKMLNTVFGAIGNEKVPTSISELLTAPNSNYNLHGDAILKLPKVNKSMGSGHGDTRLPGCGILFQII